MINQELKLEVGKRYKNGCGRIVKILEECTDVLSDSFRRFKGDHQGDSYRCDGRYEKSGESWQDLISEYIEEPMNETKEEIKLEVGKKYIFTTFLANENCEPVTFEKAHGDTYWFRDIDNKPFSLLEKHLSLFKITEHREMILKEFKGYIYPSQLDHYCESLPHAQGIDIYSNKIDFPMIYGRFTFEQLEEPKE